MGDENPIRTLGDYSKPSHEGYRNTIELPVGNNVVPLRSDTIRLHMTLTCEKMGKNSPAFISMFLQRSSYQLAINAFSMWTITTGGSYYPIPCSILSTEKDRKTPQRYPDVPTTSWRIIDLQLDRFKRLTPKSPSSWHRPLASNLIFL
ncbi:hypothetical protein Tco_1210715 [Tanacetum coccineum]